MTAAPSVVEACCSNLYGHPLVELIAGQSFHPGGLSSTRRLLDAAGLQSGARFLDAGCGLGASARLASLEFGLAVDAFDVSAVAIRRAAILADGAGATVEFLEASILRMPYEEGTFAGVLAECVLSTTSKPSALSELRRVLRPGGVLLVSDVTTAEAVAAAEPLASVLCLTGAWLPGELEDLTTSSGFRIQRTWDETAGIVALLDRVEARIGLMAALTRDLASGESLGGPIWGASSIGGPDGIAGAFRDARRLVAEGRIGYRAVVATAAAPATAIDRGTTVGSTVAG